MLRVPAGCRGHKLALEYNDVSPNENNHVASAWALLRQPEMDFIYRMSRKNQVQPTPVRRMKTRRSINAMCSLQARQVLVQTNLGMRSWSVCWQGMPEA